MNADSYVVLVEDKPGALEGLSQRVGRRLAGAGWRKVVARPYLEVFARGAGVPRDRLVVTVAEHGNVASASLPLQLVTARELGRCGPGDLVALVGLAGGVSLGITVIRL